MADTQGSTGTLTRTADEYTKAALDHVWVHSANWSELAEKKGMHVFERGQGAMLYDAHGKEWIDGIAGLWVVNAGHGRREIGEAMAEQAGKLAYVSAANYTTDPRGRAGRDHRRDLLPGDLNRVFFCSGGSEAVETRDEDRQAGPGDARLPEALQDHRPARLVPRRDLSAR